MSLKPTLQTNQTKRYKGFYSSFRGVRKLFRFDIRYRCKRLHEIFRRLGMTVENKRVLDVGFGGGDLKFQVINEANPEEYPKDDFDIIVSSHMLEHVPDDMAVLCAIHSRLTSGGVLALFVPIEEPDYLHIHLRNYSLQTITEKVRHAGFEILFMEGSMYVNGHIWKLITIPSRRNWPVVRHLVDGFRNLMLTLHPYPLLKFFDTFLFRLGFGPRQALVLARMI